MNNNISNRMAHFLREVYIEIDKDNLISFISENCFNLLEYTKEELLNKNIKEILSQTQLKSKSLTNIKSSVITKNRSVIPIDLTYRPIIDSNNNKIGFSLSLIDISSYVKFDSHEQIVNQMFERSKDIIYRAELTPTFKFTYLSPSITEILGYTPEEHFINPLIPFETAHPEDRDILIGKISNNIDFSKPLPTRQKHKDGHYVWLDDYCIPIYDDKGALIALEGFSRDITDKKQLEEKLEKLSYYDGLTGAYNKHYLDKKINIFNTETDATVGIFFCDLDNLKVTNDTFGHDYGDKLIVSTFNILKDIFIENSIIARTGGDEFIVIIENTSLNKVNELYGQLCKSIYQQNKYNSDLQVKISIGYSYSDTSLGVIKDFITIADKNMYKDKQRKKITTSQQFYQ